MFYKLLNPCIPLILVSCITASFSQSKWTWRNPLPQGNNLITVVFTGSQYLAAGINGTIMASVDGVNWEQRESGVTRNLSSAVCTDSLIVIAGDGEVITSPDGINWKSVAIDACISDICWSGKMLVAVGTKGFGGYIASSENAITWTERYDGVKSKDKIDPVDYYHSVTWTGTMFVAVGALGRVRNSQDGITWSEETWAGTRKNANSNENQSLTSVTQFKDFIYAGTSGGDIMTSTDSLVWKVHQKFNYKIDEICRTGNLLMALQGGIVIFSSDGENWENATIFRNGSAYSVVWGDSQFVAVGECGNIATSKDSRAWTMRSQSFTENIIKMLWAGNCFVAFLTDNSVVTSPDGISWKKSSELGGVRCAVWAGDRIVAGGETQSRGLLATSTDGVTWDNLSNFIPDRIVDLVWTGTKIVGITWNKTLISSFDYRSWTIDTITNIGFEGINRLVWTGSFLVAVGDAGRVWKSIDGTSWVKNSIATTLNLNSITWTGDRVYAAGYGPYNGGVWSSVDGLTWSEILDVGVHKVYDIYWTGKQIVVAGNSDISVSANGTSWRTIPTGSRSKLNSIASANSMLVVAGENGTIMTSPEEVINGTREKKSYAADNDLTVKVNGQNLEFSIPVAIRGRQISAMIYSFSGRRLVSKTILENDFVNKAKLTVRNVIPGSYILELKSRGKSAAGVFVVAF
jgi:hypothetical protein